MLGLLFLVFIALPIAELVILVRLGQVVGFWATLLIVLATGALGSLLARSQGTRVLAEVRDEVRAGRMPAKQLLDGAAIVAGGALLLTPGFISDVLGLALLFPPTRRLLLSWGRRWIERQKASGALRVTVLDWQQGPGPGTTFGEGRAPMGLDPSKEISVPAPDERQ
ncbi:MAG: FxsA family protein [Gemmatimonadetes bacterium]|nr:FxsA family protein [Gemmatimonadota bacterium]